MPKLKVLFLCTGNSCRSQMAEGWARQLKGDAIEAFSAGIEKHGMNPHAIKVMAEGGVDISKQFSKTPADLGPVPYDYVVTVCGHADENCPVFPGKTKVVHVGFEDPPKLTRELPDGEAKLAVYRRVRDEIRRFVESLPGALTAPEHSTAVPCDEAAGGRDGALVLEVYDPAMCCSTGVCGPTVDPVLVRFAGDLKWLREQGVEVRRFNLSQNPAAFVENRMVNAALVEKGEAALPLVLMGARTVASGRYPERGELGELFKIQAPLKPLPAKTSCCCGGGTC